MKKITRIFGAVLVLTMLLSLAAPIALADGEVTKVKQYGVVDENGYGGYLALGDSVFRGCGSIENYAEGNYYKYHLRNVPNSAPYIVAQAVGCVTGGEDDLMSNHNATYWPVCYVGNTLSAVLDWLEIQDNFDDPYLTAGFGGSDCLNNMITYYPAEYRDEVIKNASLISIEIGLCDVLWRTMCYATQAKGQAEEVEEGTGTAAMVETALKELYAGYNYWLNNYPKLLEYLQEKNPNADIVLVGSYNPAMNMTVTDEMVTPLLTALSTITGLMNAQYRSWAQEYGCAFADISNVETPASTNGWSYTGEEYNADTTMSGHPSIEGNTYMGRQVLSVLPQVVYDDDGNAEVVTEDPVQDVPIVIPIPGTDIKIPVVIPGEVIRPNTDIKLDLGRFKKVSYVMVDNKIVKNWSFSNPDNEFEITVPYNRKDAKILTIVVVQDDGKVAVYTFQLAYHDGYTAYRIYNTNDAVKTTSKLLTTMTNIGTKIVTTILGFFKK